MKWKVIPEFENYECSDTGLIRNKITNKILKIRHNNRNYCIVDIYKNKKKYTKLVHILVAKCFIKIPNELKDIIKIQVNHKDGNKDNNTIQNLEWCDQSYNMLEAYKTGLRKYSHFILSDESRKKMSESHKKRKDDQSIYYVEMYDLDNNFIEKFNSIKEVSKKYSFVVPSGLQEILYRTNGNNVYKNYKWKIIKKPK